MYVVLPCFNAIRKYCFRYFRNVHVHVVYCTIVHVQFINVIDKQIPNVGPHAILS